MTVYYPFWSLVEVESEPKSALQKDCCLIVAEAPYAGMAELLSRKRFD